MACDLDGVIYRSREWEIKWSIVLGKYVGWESEITLMLDLLHQGGKCIKNWKV